MKLSEWKEKMEDIDAIPKPEHLDEKKLKSAMDEWNKVIAQIHKQDEAEDWLWIDQAVERFGKRDFFAELKIYENRQKQYFLEFSKLKKHQVVEKLKTGKAIMEIKEIIQKLKKESSEENNKP